MHNQTKVQAASMFVVVVVVVVVVVKVLLLLIIIIITMFILRGFNKSRLPAVYRRLWDLLMPSVWISLMKIKMIFKKANTTTTTTPEIFKCYLKKREQSRPKPKKMKKNFVVNFISFNFFSEELKITLLTCWYIWMSHREVVLVSRKDFEEITA